MSVCRLVAFCALAAWCQVSPAPAAEKGAVEKAPAGKLAKADPFQVPDGTPDEILAFLEKLDQQRPEGEDPKAQLAYHNKMATAVVQAADKILAGKTTDDQAALGVDLKIQGLMALRAMGNADADKRLDAMPGELEKMGRQRLARQVRAVLLSRRVQALVRGGAADLGSVLVELEQFVGPEPAADDVDLVAATLEIAEQIDAKAAAKAYTTLGKRFAASKQPEVAALGAKLEGAGRRLALVGQKMELDGTTLDGKSFRLEEHAGKAVLVVFWATWCGPCRQELPDLMELYAEYKSRGLEVVSISLDSEREDLASFVKEYQIPWAVLFDPAPGHQGFDNPVATRYGVMRIPTTMLLDKQGKGVALDVRGPELRRKVATLLGSGASGEPKATGVEGTVVPLPLPAFGAPNSAAKP